MCRPICRREVEPTNPPTGNLEFGLTSEKANEAAGGAAPKVPLLYLLHFFLISLMLLPSFFLSFTSSPPVPTIDTTISYCFYSIFVSFVF